MNHNKTSPALQSCPSGLNLLPVSAKAFVKLALLSAFAVLSLLATSPAKELPNAPSAELMSSSFVAESPVRVSVPKAEVVEKNPVDAKFVSLALISTGSTFADSYTTLFARQNWLAGKKGVCNMEVESPYLYGIHPTVGRVYAVASAKSVGSVMAAYYLRRHHSRLWSVPLVANSIISLQGVTQNMIACN